MTRPSILLHAMMSIDGRLTLASDVLLLHGDPRWDALTVPGVDVYQGLMSAYQPQALLEGSGSFVLPGQVSDPLPAYPGDPGALYQSYLPQAVVQQPGRKWFVVVDSRGRVRWMFKEFPGETWSGWHLLVLTSRQTPAEYLAYLRSQEIPYLVAGNERVDLGQAVEALQRELGVEQIVATGGGQLSGALLRSSLIDEISLEVLPAAIGGAGVPSLFDAPPLLAGQLPTRLKLLECRPQPDGRLLLYYRVLNSG